MGSSSSNLGSTSSPPPKHTKVNRTKQRLASFICGASASSSSEREDFAAGSVLNSADYSQQKANKSSSPINNSYSTSSMGTGFSSYCSPRSGVVSSSDSSNISSEFTSIQDSRVESSGKRKCSSEVEEVVLPHTVNAERKHHQRRLADSVSISSTGQSQHIGLSSNAHTDDLNNDMLQISSEILPPTSLQHQEPEQATVLEEVTEITGSQSSDSVVLPDVSDSGLASQSRGDEAIREAMPSGLELFVSDRTEARSGSEESLLHVDLVSISSNLLPNINNETSTREARRNSRRMFRDAFSSRSSRRNADFPAILFATEDSSLMGSHRRWLLDLGDDFFDDSVDAEPWRFGRRSRFTNDRLRNSRSEFWDRLRGAATENTHRTSCPLDLHPHGSCTCEVDEEASALSSISRIILLAEALFEVLDEIHRQPDSFSLSMLSVPAPESVVDSLPIKTYEKASTADHGDDADQCYICLVEYEKGDKIRVLPCQHAYHMSCVDKWLKEIHGICPLCRGDVRGGATEVAASSSDSVIT